MIDGGALAKWWLCESNSNNNYNNRRHHLKWMQTKCSDAPTNTGRSSDFALCRRSDKMLPLICRRFVVVSLVVLLLPLHLMTAWYATHLALGGCHCWLFLVLFVVSCSYCCLCICSCCFISLTHAHQQQALNIILHRFKHKTRRHRTFLLLNSFTVPQGLNPNTNNNTTNKTKHNSVYE